MYVYIYICLYIYMYVYIYIYKIYTYIYTYKCIDIYNIYIYNIYIYTHTPSLLGCRMAPAMLNPGYATGLKVRFTRFTPGVYMHLFVGV